MEVEIPAVDAQKLYRQWQDGKLLNNAERLALGPPAAPEPGQPLFAEMLQSVTDRTS